MTDADLYCSVMANEEKQMTFNARHYYRCYDCLSVVATVMPWAQLACECGGRLEYLGKVHKDSRLGATISVTPCNSICTHASGPCCSCSCGGANHGSHRTVQVFLDRGPVPTVQSASPKVAEEFRAAVEAAQERIARLPGRADQLNGRWIDYDQFCRIREELTALRKARAMKVHKLRMKKLAGIAIEQQLLEAA